MTLPSYIRRAVEIELAMLVDWIYIRHKSTQGVIDYFKATAKILAVSDFELIESAIIHYKKLMPTKEELAVMSDLAIQSRSRFIKSDIVNNKMSRKTFYKTLQESPSIEQVLMPKLKNIINDAIYKFIKEFEVLSKQFYEFSINNYEIPE